MDAQRRTLADVLRERGKLGPYPVPEEHVAPAPADSAVVRAWAVEHGIDVPQRGRIPAAVLDAYRRST